MNQKVKKGTKLVIRMNDPKDKLHKMVGIVKYIGLIQDKKNQGDYIGLEIDKDYGKNDGTYKGKEYFKTKPNHGVFLKPSSLAFLNGTPVLQSPSKTGPAKLSKDIGEMMANENEELKKEIEELTMKMKEFEELDWKKEIDELKKKVKELQDINRSLKIEGEKIKYAVSDKDDERIQELNQKIQFFKSQKEQAEKEKNDLKKKNSQLMVQLEEYAAEIEMAEENVMKIQSLKQKNDKLKQELESVNLEMRNARMVGNRQSDSNAEELVEEVKVLNETVTLMESELNEEREKNSQLTTKLESQEKKMGEMKKLQLKLRSKEEEIAQMAEELEANAESAAYAEKLIMDMFKKDEEVKEVNVKINEYIKKVETLEGELVEGRELQDEMNQELFNQQELMETYMKQADEKNNHIQQLNRQIQKYKKKICQLTQSTESMISSMTLGEQSINKEEEMPKSMMNIDMYQTKYYNAMKIIQNTNAKFLKNQIQFSQMRNQVGVYMLNLHEALPQSFTTKLYPEVVAIIVSIKSANDKLYYLFEAVVDNFRHKPDMYSRDNQQLCQWMIVLMKQISSLYSSLQKLQFSLTTSDSQEELSEILSHKIIREEIRKIDTFAIELLTRFSEDNVTSSIDFEPFTSPLENLDAISLELKKNFSTEYDVKMKLCSEGMEIITNTYEMISEFKFSSELGQNAQVDNLLENFIKSVSVYLYECCMNPYIRYKAEMKEYIKGMNIITFIYNEIKSEGNLHQLSSLYSESENIQLLKDTILNMQYHAKELLRDLEDIHYPNTLSKLQTQLTGKVWSERIKLVKDELVRFKEVIEEKKQLQLLLTEKKKKILQLEKELKDKQSTKELHEKKIGELQLKIEQSVSIQNENKRLNDKLKSYEETNKLIEEEIGEQSKKRKMLEEELKKTKDKYDVLQTQTMLRNKKQKNINSISSEDVANLTIFKNAIKESNIFRNIQIKKKLIQLKQSPLLAPEENDADEEVGKKSALRRKGLDELSKLKVNDPFSAKQQNNTVIVDNLIIEANKLKFEQGGEKKGEKQVQIGQLVIGDKGIKEVRLQQSINQIVGY